MIRRLTIENFKGIRDAVTIPIRPITLLFGKNSAGKSTVIQALHYLREVCESRRPDPDRTQIGGDVIDLGGFQSLVHCNELDRMIRIRAEFGVDDDGVPNIGVTSPGGTTGESESLSVDLNEIAKLDAAWVEIKTAWQEDSGAYIAEYAAGLNGQELVRCGQSPGLRPEILGVNFDHPLVLELARQIGDEDDPVGLRERMWSLYEDAVDASDASGRYSKPVPLNESESIIPDPSRPFLVDDDFNDASVYQDPETQYRFWSMVGQALTGPLALLLEELKGIRYIGAIRDVPPRTHRSPKTPDESRWARGLGAWDALVRNPDLVARASRYTQDVLKLGYSLRREQRLFIDADGEIMAELRLLASQYEERDAGYLRKRILEPLEHLPRHPAIQIHDEQQDIDVDPSDVGVGISQVLPVVVGALDAGTEKRPCRILAIEQPELHVHPAVQVALGDLFIEAIEDSERTMLIETHSEHLLLRLLRRVREAGAITRPSLSRGDGIGYGGGQGDGAGYGDGTGYGRGTGGGAGDDSGHGFDLPSRRVLAAEDLSIVYVRPTKDGVELTPLAVTADGDFDEPWPEGFFDERDSELF